MAVMWVIHDLGVVADLVKVINVMYAGFIVGRGFVQDIYKHTHILTQ
jgi:ABC-type dipeptide/oligopeptide/nickel transport system ATPase component